jgi:hypothetical protein
MTSNPNDSTTEFLEEQELRVGDLATPILLRISRRKADGALLITQSHFVKTAIQYLPYSANQPYFCPRQEAVDRILSIMKNFYDQAIRRGYKPTEGWLVENTRFKSQPHNKA